MSSFPLKEELKLEKVWNESTKDFENMLKEIEGMTEITEEKQKEFQTVLDDYSNTMAEKLINVASMFQGKVYADWMADLKTKEPLVYTEITNSKSWVQENIKYQQETAEKSFRKLNGIRQDRKYEYFKSIDSQFDFRINKKKLSKGDDKWIKNYLKAQGYDKLIPKLDKFTGEDLTILKSWVKNRNKLVARDMAGNIYSQELREMSLANDIEEFIWMTEQDLRVRPTHIVRQGNTYNFAKVDFLPGQEILCRCWAVPIKPKNKK